ncbi:MAG: OmpH family outer membrane protein [Phycisphaerae bacterium]
MKRYRRLIILCSAAIIAAVVLPHALAQSGQFASPTRVAVCDVVSIFRDYDKAKNIIADLESRREQIQQEDQQRQQQLEDLQMELQSYTPGSDQYVQTRNEMERLAIDRKAWLEYQQAVALREHHEKTREIYTEIINKVRQVAEQSGYDLVLFRSQQTISPTQSTGQLLEEIERRQVLYSSDRVDITPVVLDALNAEYTGGRG